MWYFRKIVGRSMEPSYREGQIVLLQNTHTFSVGDVVIGFVKKKEVIKRITQMKKDFVFLEGDNKAHSTDSRHYGWVLDTYIDAKVIWPKRKLKINK